MLFFVDELYYSNLGIGITKIIPFHPDPLDLCEFVGCHQPGHPKYFWETYLANG